MAQGPASRHLRLGSALGWPVVHLDAHFWRPGWRDAPRDAWTVHVAELAATRRWVMDGHYRSTLALRARVADTVVVLAPPRLTCVTRLIRRGLRDRGRGRADLAPRCPEQLPEWAFLLEAWAFATRELPRALAVLQSPEAVRPDGTHARVVVLRSAREADRFIADEIERVYGSGPKQTLEAVTRDYRDYTGESAPEQSAERDVRPGT